MNPLSNHMPSLSNMPNEAWTDINSLNNIKNEKDSDEALKKVAKQFESLFFNMLLKNMRKANEAFEKDSLFTNNESRMYRDMYDNQLSLTLGAKTGIGIADAMYRQLKGDQNALAYQNSLGEVDKKALENDFERFTKDGFPLDYDHVASKLTGNIYHAPNVDSTNSTEDKSASLLSQNSLIAIGGSSASDSRGRVPVVNGEPGMGTQTAAIQPLVTQPLVKQPLVTRTSETMTEIAEVKSVTRDSAIPADENFSPKSPKEFVRGVLPYVKSAAKHLGLNPLVMVAQAALETGWGKHILSDSTKGSSNNLFNIKADERWSGQKTRQSTLEFIDGLPEKQIANFRRYSSIAESVNDFIDFIRGNPRYEKALESVNDEETFISELHEAGYATDPDYSQKIIRIFNQLESSDLVKNLMSDDEVF